MSLENGVRSLGSDAIDGINNVVKLAIDGASKAVGGILALVGSFLPAGMGEALASAGARGASSMDENHRSSSSVAPPALPAVASSQQQSNDIGHQMSPEMQQAVLAVADRFRGAINVVQSVGREMLGEMSPGYTPPVQVLSQGRDQGFSRGA